MSSNSRQAGYVVTIHVPHFEAYSDHWRQLLLAGMEALGRTSMTVSKQFVGGGADSPPRLEDVTVVTCRLLGWRNDLSEHVVGLVRQAERYALHADDFRWETWIH